MLFVFYVFEFDCLCCCDLLLVFWGMLLVWFAIVCLIWFVVVFGLELVVLVIVLLLVGLDV